MGPGYVGLTSLGFRGKTYQQETPGPRGRRRSVHNRDTSPPCPLSPPPAGRRSNGSTTPPWQRTDDIQHLRSGLVLLLVNWPTCFILFIAPTRLTDLRGHAGRMSSSNMEPDFTEAAVGVEVDPQKILFLCGAEVYLRPLSHVHQQASPNSLLSPEEPDVSTICTYLPSQLHHRLVTSCGAQVPFFKKWYCHLGNKHKPAMCLWVAALAG